MISMATAIATVTPIPIYTNLDDSEKNGDEKSVVDVMIVCTLGISTNDAYAEIGVAKSDSANADTGTNARYRFLIIFVGSLMNKSTFYLRRPRVTPRMRRRTLLLKSKATAIATDTPIPM